MKNYKAKMQKIKEDIMFCTVVVLASAGAGFLIAVFATLWFNLFY